MLKFWYWSEYTTRSTSKQQPQCDIQNTKYFTAIAFCPHFNVRGHHVNIFGWTKAVAQNDVLVINLQQKKNCIEQGLLRGSLSRFAVFWVAKPNQASTRPMSAGRMAHLAASVFQWLAVLVTGPTVIQNALLFASSGRNNHWYSLRLPTEDSRVELTMGGWLHNEVVCTSKYGQPSQYSTGPAWSTIVCYHQVKPPIATELSWQAETNQQQQ